MNRALKTTRIDRFLDQPNARTFTQLQRQLQRSSVAQSRLMQLNTLHRMMDAGAYEEVLAECDSLFADFCLSPRFHFLRGQAAIQTGNAQLADEARALSQECLYWLCELGDGTFESPYQITYLSDISDILGAFRLKKRHQEAVEGPNGRLDVVTLHDGTEIWFDVQNLLN